MANKKLKGKIHKPLSVDELVNGKGYVKLSDYTYAAQRQMLVSLNRESNKRLQEISKAINKGKLPKSVLTENTELSRIGKRGKDYKILAHKRFTLGKKSATTNALKTEMEEQIKERVAFLRQPTSSTTGIKEYYGTRQQQLLEVYNSLFGTDKKRLTLAESQQFGSLLNTARSLELIASNGEIYTHDGMTTVENLSNKKSYKSFKDWMSALEEDIVLEKKRRAATSSDSAKELMTELGGGTHKPL